MKSKNSQGLELEDAAAAVLVAANQGPVECAVICNKKTLELIAAVFYCQSNDSSATWVYYVGVDGAGGFESGFMCFMVNEADTEYEHFYLSIDGESFYRDAASGEDVELPLRPEDKLAFDALVMLSNSWIMFDDDSEIYAVQRRRRRKFAENDQDSTRIEYYSDDVDPELLNVISAAWAVQFQFCCE